MIQVTRSSVMCRIVFASCGIYAPELHRKRVTSNAYFQAVRAFEFADSICIVSARHKELLTFKSLSANRRIESAPLALSRECLIKYRDYDNIINSLSIAKHWTSVLWVSCSRRKGQARHPEWRRRFGKSIGPRWSNLTVSTISYLHKINSLSIPFYLDKLEKEELFKILFYIFKN